MAAVAARTMKRRSISVFTPVSRTRGVGHRRGEARKILPSGLGLLPEVGDDETDQRQGDKDFRPHENQEVGE